MGIGAAWLAAGALLVAGVLVRFWRVSVARAAALEVELQAATERCADLDAKWAREAQARKRQAEELATLRKRTDKAKRRQDKPAETPLGTASRIRDHQAEIERLGRERDRVVAANEELTRRASTLEGRLAASQRALDDVTSAAASPEVPAPDTGSDAELDGLRSELAAAREQASKLEEELSERRQGEMRLRKRTETQEKLYASVRAELEVKKDRLRTQEEQLQRLQALKVAIVD